MRGAVKSATSCAPVVNGSLVAGGERAENIWDKDRVAT